MISANSGRLETKALYNDDVSEKTLSNSSGVSSKSNTLSDRAIVNSIIIIKSSNDGLVSPRAILLILSGTSNV